MRPGLPWPWHAEHPVRHGLVALIPAASAARQRVFSAGVDTVRRRQQEIGGAVPHLHTRPDTEQGGEAFAPGDQETCNS